MYTHAHAGKYTWMLYMNQLLYDPDHYYNPRTFYSTTIMPRCVKQLIQNKIFMGCKVTCGPRSRVKGQATDMCMEEVDKVSTAEAREVGQEE